MSTTAIYCSKCGVQNINTAQFCGGCGASVASAQPAQLGAQPQMASPATAAKNDKDWHEMAGLICGVVSMFLCGVFAAAPGFYFSWSARGIAKEQGRGTGLATTGMVLNGIGVLVTFGWLVILIISVAMSAGQPDPMMNNMQNPYGF